MPYACSIRFLAVTFMVRDSVAVLADGIALSLFDGLTVATSNEGSGPVACSLLHRAGRRQRPPMSLPATMPSGLNSRHSPPSSSHNLVREEYAV